VELPECLFKDKFCSLRDIEALYDFMSLEQMNFFIRKPGVSIDNDNERKTLYHSLIIGRLQNANKGITSATGEQGKVIWDLLELKYQVFLQRRSALMHFAKLAGKYSYCSVSYSIHQLSQLCDVETALL
jgi:hypothetical protein